MDKAIKNRRIRIAVVGCGRISQNHFDAIGKHIDDLELVAVCDQSSAVLDNIVAQHSVTGYKQLPDMLEKEDLDIVAFYALPADCIRSKRLYPRKAVSM